MLEIGLEQLLDQLREQLANAGKVRLATDTAKEPYWPMLVVTVGEDSAPKGAIIRDSLLQVWPQYANEIVFVEAKASGEEWQFSIIGSASNGQLIPADTDTGAVIDGLFSASSCFHNHDRLLLYYLVDPSGSGIDEYGRWESSLPVLRTSLNIGGRNYEEMAFLLLDEEAANRDVSGMIRARVGEQCERNPSWPGHSLFLISNLGSDNLIRCWDDCLRAVANLILLSNNSVREVSDALFLTGIKAAGYECEAKPIRDIGQVVVTSLVDYFADALDREQLDESYSEDLAARLGVCEDGTLSIVGEYVQQRLQNHVPSQEQVALFPRKSIDEDIESLSAQSFDEATMGTWSALLQRIVSTALQELDPDDPRNKGADIWMKRYQSALRRAFSSNELIKLADNTELVYNVLSQKAPCVSMGSVFDAPDRLVARTLSCEEHVIDLVVRAVKAQGMQSKCYKQQWKELRQSTRAVHQSKDCDLVDYYQGIVRNYLASNQTALLKEFDFLDTMEGFQVFFQSVVGDIIVRHAEFTDSFDVELGKRLEDDKGEGAKKAYASIRQKLAAEEIPLLFKVPYSLGSPIISAILHETDSELCHKLKEALPGTTYFYDTGLRDRAEAIAVYDVDPALLLAGDGR